MQAGQGVNKKFYSASEMSGSLCAHCGTAQQHFPENLINVKIRKNLLTQSPSQELSDHQQNGLKIPGNQGQTFAVPRSHLCRFP